MIGRMCNTIISLLFIYKNIIIVIGCLIWLVVNESPIGVRIWMASSFVLICAVASHYWYSNRKAKKLKST